MTRTDAERVLHGSCLERLCELPDASIDAVVTDPPYGLSNVSTSTIVEAVTQWATGNREFIPDARGFMGKAWDAFVPPPAVWDECLRVLKPGGHLLAFAGSRTFDLMGLSIRFAGFEVRDSVAWLYGSGFPKSLDVSKAIDKRPGVTQHGSFARHLAAQREAAGLSRAEVSERVVGTRSGACWNWEHHQFPEAKWWPDLRDLLNLDHKWGAVIAEQERAIIGQRHSTELAVAPGQRTERANVNVNISAPATDAARKWQGWGTALKPAFEPVVVARKPLEGTVARNVLAHGTGALNIDACRIGDSGGGTRCDNRDEHGHCRGHDNAGRSTSGQTIHGPDASGGRWPSNVMLDEHAARTLNQQEPNTARFFYVAKTSTAERNAGLDHFEKINRYKAGGVGGTDGLRDVQAAVNAPPVANFHPTVKPLTLMRELVRLVTPPDGVVLDPFLGSGTTACAAILEGFDWIGCELTDEYLPIIAARVAWARNEAAKQPEPLFDTTPHTKRTLSIEETLQLELDA